MAHYIQKDQLQIDAVLFDFIETEVLPDTGVAPEAFWTGFNSLCADLIPVNQTLLNKRDRLQSLIDEYNKTHSPLNPTAYKQFLAEIGYLQPNPADFKITTQHVDSEIATMAGPQLVVPINNARYALNAANARWGSLYDAFYGTDIITESDGAEKTASYNPGRGQKVVALAREWLDTIAPLKAGTHKNAIEYHISSGQLVVSLADGGTTELSDPSTYIGYKGELSSPSAILMKHNGLHAEIQIDASHPIGKTDPANVKDILIESALTTIMDCEDSVAAVDAEDKLLVYKNWLGLMKGNLSIAFEKGGQTLQRTMKDRKSVV